MEQLLCIPDHQLVLLPSDYREIWDVLIFPELETYIDTNTCVHVLFLQEDTHYKFCFKTGFLLIDKNYWSVTVIIFFIVFLIVEMILV